MVDMKSALSPLGTAATSTAATGVNSSGQIVGSYGNSSGESGSFVYTIGGTATSVILPGGGTESFNEGGHAAINATRPDRRELR